MSNFIRCLICLSVATSTALSNCLSRRDEGCTIADGSEERVGDEEHVSSLIALLQLSTSDPFVHGSMIVPSPDPVDPTVIAPLAPPSENQTAPSDDSECPTIIGYIQNITALKAKIENQADVTDKAWAVYNRSKNHSHTATHDYVEAKSDSESANKTYTEVVKQEPPDLDSDLLAKEQVYKDLLEEAQRLHLQNLQDYLDSLLSATNHTLFQEQGEYLDKKSKLLVESLAKAKEMLDACSEAKAATEAAFDDLSKAIQQRTLLEDLHLDLSKLLGELQSIQEQLGGDFGDCPKDLRRFLANYSNYSTR